LTTTHETRTRARETKFVTEVGRAPAIAAWIRERLGADIHGAGPHGDQYATSTLYFETDAFDVYHRRGSYGRSKYRIRRYGTMDDVFLERKFRTSRLLAKRRTLVPLADIQKLGCASSNPHWDGHWFHRRVRLRGLKPLVQLSYTRIARSGTSDTGPVRVTIDTNLRILPMPDLAFLSGCGQPFLEDCCIVEMKYQVAAPALFKALAETFRLDVQKISKFRAGLRALDYPLETDPDEQVPHPALTAEADPAGRYAD